MPRELYNEGRVVGLSAYEIYVRHAMSINPTAQPASELEWLSSSVATGSSMILKIEGESPSISGHHFQEVALPSNSQLGAANTIIGSLFLGTVNLDSSGRWATNVTSYGPLLDNDAEHPTPGTPDSQDDIYPTAVTSSLDSTYQENLKEYMKIVDGIIIQQGKWVTTEGGITPPKDLTKPDFTQSPKVRILLSDTVVHPFYIILTGFTLKAVLTGVAGMDGSTRTIHPQNGDFLGPAVFPWANKIVFSVPPAYINYYLRSDYARTLNSSLADVENIPIIDMATTDPSTYYETNYATNPISYTVTKANNVKGDAVLTVYQRSLDLPPALYGTKVTATGNNKLYPLDTVAPGTVKIFDSASSQNETDAVNNIPGNIGMYRDADYIIHQTVPETASDPTDPISDVEVESVFVDGESVSNRQAFAVRSDSGKKSAKSVSLVDNNGDELNLLGGSGSMSPSSASSASFALTTQQPDDWNAEYMRYYLQYNTYPFYRPVTKIDYKLTEEQPDDWDVGTGWDNYFTRTGVPPYVRYARLTVEPTPTWVDNKYYEPISPNYVSNTYYEYNPQSHQYVLLTSDDAPANWDIYIPALHKKGWMTYYIPDPEQYRGYINIPPITYHVTHSEPYNWANEQRWRMYYTKVGSYTYELATSWEYGLYYQQGTANEFVPDWEPNAYYELDSSYQGQLHWNDLLYALSNNRSIDLFSNKYFRNQIADALANYILRAGAGISLQYNEASSGNTIDITNTATDISKLPALQSDDYAVLYKYEDGCCGKFRINIADGTKQKLSIRYSAAKQGVPASLYIQSNATNYLVCEAFTRSYGSDIDSGTDRPLPKTKLSNRDVYGNTRPNFYPDAFYTNEGDLSSIIRTEPQNWDTSDDWKDYYKVLNQFWFRHTKDDPVGLQMSRMVRIVLNFDNVYKGKTLKERLNLTSITNVIDTSEGATGIWNVQDSTTSEAVGASWQAGCKVEQCETDDCSIFVYGINYADGWNTQVGENISQSYPHGENLKSDHINLKVSAMLWGDLYDNNI
jgi:hypothetical protein